MLFTLFAPPLGLQAGDGVQMRGLSFSGDFWNGIWLGIFGETGVAYVHIYLCLPHRPFCATESAVAQNICHVIQLRAV